MLEQIINWMITGVDLAVIAGCYWYYLAGIRRTIYRKWWIYVVALVLLSVSLLIVQPYFDDVGRCILCIGGTILLGQFLFDRGLRAAFYQTMISVFIFLGQYLAIFIVIALWDAYFIQTNNMYIYAVLLYGVKWTVECLMSWTLTHLVKLRGNADAGKKQLAGLFLVPAISLAMVFSMLLMGNLYIFLYGYGLLIFNLILIVGLNIYCLYIYYNISKTQKLKLKLAVYESVNQMQLKYYESLEEKYTMSRKVIHDIRNHINAIEGLYVNNENEAARDYVSNIHHMLNELGQKYYTSNRMLNIILNEKEQKAKAAGMTVAMDIREAGFDFMNDLDLTTIFGNLLDNAIESGGDRLVVRMNKFNDFMVIDISNTLGYKEKIPKTNGRTGKHHTGRWKTGHMGLGLSNVKNTLDRYDANYSFKKQDHWYTVNISVPVPEAGQRI